ncbi:MAG: hypothetical protein WAR79_05165, partial [Melioribacteraceae bacterium]
DSLGTMRAFIGKVRNDNGIDFDTDLFVAEIPLDVEITTSYSGSQTEYPRPPQGIKIRRLTNGLKVSGIVRGSYDGKTIAFTALDKNNVKQIFVTKADGTQKNPQKITSFNSDCNSVRWHPNNNYLFFVSEGNIYIASIFSDKENKIFKLTDDNLERTQLVVSHDGKRLAYVIATQTRDSETELVKDAVGNDYKQIFIMEIIWEKINSSFINLSEIS